MFNKLSRRERMLLIILAVVAVIALYYYTLYLPLSDKIAVLEDDKAYKENQLNQYLITVGRMPVLQARYEELKPLRLQVTTMVNSADGLLQALENASVKSGVKITSFIPDNRKEFIQVNMLADGTYEELVLFLEGIKKLRGQVEFKKIIVARKEQGDDSLNINSTFILHKELNPGGGQR